MCISRVRAICFLGYLHILPQLSLSLVVNLFPNLQERFPFVAVRYLALEMWRDAFHEVYTGTPNISELAISSTQDGLIMVFASDKATPGSILTIVRERKQVNSFYLQLVNTDFQVTSVEHMVVYEAVDTVTLTMCVLCADSRNFHD